MLGIGRVGGASSEDCLGHGTSDAKCEICGLLPCAVSQFGTDAYDCALDEAPREAAKRGQAISNSNYRYVLYRFFSQQLGLRERTPLPRCVMNWIEERYGRSETGFKAK